MAITAFPALAPRLPSVAYPDNFKLNIQKYDGRSDPNIWLSTYYVTVKEVGGNFDHMAAYFPLVLGDAPSLWLNKLPTGSIKSWDPRPSLRTSRRLIIAWETPSTSGG
jgi:hypothetical protein